MADLIKEALAAHWGDKCLDFDPDCACCRAWAEFAALEAEASEGERRGLEVERLAAFNAMLIRDNKRYQETGSALAAAALRVTSEFDGVHRLRLATSAWAKAAADEGDRALIPEAPVRESNRD